MSILESAHPKYFKSVVFPLHEKMVFHLVGLYYQLNCCILLLILRISKKIFSLFHIKFRWSKTITSWEAISRPERNIVETTIAFTEANYSLHLTFVSYLNNGFQKRTSAIHEGTISYYILIGIP